MIRAAVALGMLGVLCVKSYGQTPVSLVIDGAQSSATIGGNLAGNTLLEQGPGSLTTTAEGSMDVVMSRQAVTFTAGDVDLNVNGVWAPGIGGVDGTAPGDAAGQVVIWFIVPIGGADVAMRNVVFDNTSDAIDVVGTGFDSTEITFTATSGTVDYRGWGVLSSVSNGMESLVGSSGPTDDNNGLLEIAGDTCTLTVPLELSIPLTAITSNDSLGTFDGVLVVTGAVPQEAIMAYAPTPDDGAASVLPDTMLVWSSAYYAVSHNVYFGTDPTDVANATTGSPEYKGNHAGASHDPGALAQVTPYYWRIDEIATGGAVTEGAVWSFTTAAGLPFSETFEVGDPGMANVPGQLHGQHGWDVDPVAGAMVQNTNAHGGAQACLITNGVVSQAFVSNAKRVRIECYLKPSFFSATPEAPAGSAAVLWVNDAGNIGAYDGDTAKTSTAVTLASDTWAKFTILLDYTTQRWSLEVNDTAVLSDYAFNAALTGFSKLSIVEEPQGTSYLDDVNVTAYYDGLLFVIE